MTAVRDLVRRAVTATNPHWPMSAINRWPYRVAIATTARRLDRLGHLRALYLRNGLTRPDWEPAVSDIDLVLVTRPVEDPRRDYALVQAVWREYAAAKRMFPMLGEMDVIAEADVVAWSRIGAGAAETRRWQAVAGSAIGGLGVAPDAAGVRRDAANHALFHALDVLQDRFCRGEDSALALRAARRVAAKVAGYSALARGRERESAPRVPDGLGMAGLAAHALGQLDRMARELDDAPLWPEGAGAAAIEGAGAALARGEPSPARPALPPPHPAVEAVVDVGATRIFVLKDALDAAAIERALAAASGASAGEGGRTRVLTPAVFAHWIRCADPFLYTYLLAEGRVLRGADVALPPAPPERAFAQAVLAQAPNVIALARSPFVVAPLAAQFVAGRGFDLAIERAAFIAVLRARGTVPPWHDRLAAQARAVEGAAFARAADLRERAARDPGAAGWLAFELLSALAGEVARGVASRG